MSAPFLHLAAEAREAQNGRRKLVHLALDTGTLAGERRFPGLPGDDPDLQINQLRQDAFVSRLD